MMKRFLALLLTLSLAFSLAACGGDSGETTTPPASSAGTEAGESAGNPVTITVASFNIGNFTEAGAWDSLITAFNEKYPNVTVEIMPVTYADGDQQLTGLITGGGSAIDVVFEGPERIISNYAKEGLLVSLDDFSFTGNFSAVVSCIGNVGPGLAEVGPMGNYAAYSGFSKFVLSMCMIIGRLEVLPVMVLFSASAWKQS